MKIIRWVMWCPILIVTAWGVAQQPADEPRPAADSASPAEAEASEPDAGAEWQEVDETTPLFDEAEASEPGGEGDPRAAVGTAFTYQGRLKSGGAPANGTFDMRFTLYDDANAIVAGPICGAGSGENVQVTDGLFTVVLDFGAVFNGDNRHLEIAVRTDPTSSVACSTPSPAYTTLTPKQKLTLTPYAARSLAPWVTSGTDLAYSAGNVGIGNNNPQERLHIGTGAVDQTIQVGDYASFSQMYSSAASVIGNNVKPTNGTDGLVFMQNDLEYGGRAIVLRAEGIMFHAADSGAVAGAPFSNEIMRIGNDGKVGIGTTSPGENLTVAGTVYSTTGGFKLPDGTIVDEAGDLGGASFWTANGSDISNSNLGNVGIGTTAPGKRLQVGDTNVANSEGMIQLESRSGTGTSNRTWAIGVPETDEVTTGAGYSFVIDDAALGTTPEFLLKYGTGYVGIGTTSPAYELHVARENELNADMAIDNTNPAGNTRSRLWLKTVDQSWSLENDGVADVFKIYDQTASAARLAIDPSGSVGIGTTSPAQKLDVAGQTVIRGDLSIQESANETASISAIEGTTGAQLTLRRADGTTTVELDAEYGAIGAGARMDLYDGTNATPTIVLDARNGTATCKILAITGADLAEKFPVSDQVEPGMVVEIDPDNPGKLRLSKGEYNRRVAGVVSGANGLSVGAVLGNLPGHEDAPPIALSGRVWVHCDATTGAIQPGDLLTTSDTAGHAMKVSDYPRGQGAIIGKAMTPLAQGTRGLLLVLVSLQ